MAQSKLPANYFVAPFNKLTVLGQQTSNSYCFLTHKHCIMFLSIDTIDTTNYATDDTSCGIIEIRFTN